MNYIAPMKTKVRRTIVMIIFAVILFSASMVLPAVQNSQFKQIMQGAGIGLMLAAVISSITALIEYFKSDKPQKKS